MELRSKTNEYGITVYETEHLGIPEYCALVYYPQYEGLQVTLDGYFTLEELKNLVSYMEQINANRG